MEHATFISTEAGERQKKPLHHSWMLLGSRTEGWGRHLAHTNLEVDKGSRASLIALAGAKSPGAGCCWMSLWVCTPTSRACPRKPAGEGHAGGNAARIAHTPPFPTFAYISSGLL